MKGKFVFGVCVVGACLIASSGCSSMERRARTPVPRVMANTKVIECDEHQHDEIEGGMYPSGTNLVFSIRENQNSSYQIQWFRNGEPLPNENGNTLAIVAGPDTVGFYTATVLETKKNDQQKHWFCGPHEVQVYRFVAARVRPELIVPRKGPSPDPEPSATFTNVGGTFTLTASPLASSGVKNAGGCPGSYVGYVNFRKTVANGWGWTFDTGTTHTVSDPSSDNTKVEFTDKLAHSTGCGTQTMTNPLLVQPSSTDPFRFTVYFPSGPLPPSYSISLTGFNP